MGAMPLTTPAAEALHATMAKRRQRETAWLEWRRVSDG
jgi:hypothetical protein